jgi:lysophospholipase L1-like esterase
VSASKPGRLALAGLAAAGTLLACVAVEAGLRLGGFRFDQMPTVQFGWPDPTTIAEAYEPDPDLLWVTKNYRGAVDAARRNTPAVIFLGDSCTEFGTYPRKTMELMKRRDPSLANGVKLGVGGWSTEQGLLQLQRDVLPLHPRIITIYFGWNDHWMAFGPPDEEMVGHRSAVPAAAGRLRILQLVTALRLRSRRSNGSAAPRVPLGRYRRNLETMVHLARDAGIRSVLITAPSGHVRGHEPQMLQQRHIRDLHELIPTHQRYVQATRMAARASGAVLCDGSARFDALADRKPALFQHDGIHLRPEGDAELAPLVADCIQQAAK